MRRHSSLRRSEGATEYVVITFLISACVIVGMFRFGGKIQETMEKAEICINCEAGAESDKTGADADGDENKDEDGANEDDANNDEPLPWYDDPRSSYYWVAQLIRWFGGAPHFMDLMFPSRA
jgi:Flp pilus assembly pilin Flp